ncbi:DUF11 domain-containing protein [Lysobacter sp. Root604]|uniref:DUF11 domain-containing protein n=1 Tax=Lysobacter sp. Root604 TaxID=1736568 RepID=UPI000712623E|nr:DUF11 domain-containing protein [Lysobacter sp. Root604]KRA17473.1 hypothetical protein ASD69_12350 [Lysobacter sp. Root604]
MFGNSFWSFVFEGPCATAAGARERETARSPSDIHAQASTGRIADDCLDLPVRNTSRSSGVRKRIWLACLCSAGLLLSGQASAQTCSALTPVIAPTLPSGVAAPWSETIVAGTGWGNAGGGGVTHTENFGGNAGSLNVFNSMQQTVAGGVTGGSDIVFSVSWANASGSNGVNGNQARLEVRYNNVVYATFNTSTYRAAGPLAPPAPFASNGAVLTLVSGDWNVSGLPSMKVYRITLPAGVASGAVLQFRTSRTQNGTSDGATDDFTVRLANIETPTVCLVKQTNRQESAKGFVYTTVNLDADLITAGTQGNPTVVTLAANTPSTFDSWADNGTVTASLGIQPMVVANRFLDTGITESAFGVYRVTAINCTGWAIAPTYDVSTGAVLLPANSVIPASPVTCTYTNSRPRVRLQKQLPNGRIAPADQFSLSVAGTETAIAATRTASTTGSGSTANGTADFANADTATNYTLSEAMAAGSASTIGAYTTSYSCTNATAGTGTVMPSGNGSSFSLSNLAALDDITCVFSNQTSSADLSITKTNTPGVNGEVDQANDSVTAGGTTGYTLRVTNSGPTSITGAVVRDTPGTGITCPGGNAVTITGDGVPVGTFTIANLTGAGITLGTLTTGQTAVLSFSCNVQ